MFLYSLSSVKSVINSNCSKSLNTLFHTFLDKILLFMQLFLKILNGMANTVDPNQTAPSGAIFSGSTLHMQFLSETVVFEML